ncbi:hypothetical protein RFI_40076, partial [Reticulomyxa filosa]
MSFLALISIEYKTSKVTLDTLSLEILEDKVKELISNRTDLEAENPFNFKIMDINYQCINNEQKLRNTFETSPTNLFIHFIDDDEEKQDIENIELDQNKPWNEANKIAHTIVEQMVKKNQSGIVV